MSTYKGTEINGGASPTLLLVPRFRGDKLFFAVQLVGNFRFLPIIFLLCDL